MYRNVQGMYWNILGMYWHVCGMYWNVQGMYWYLNQEATKFQSPMLNIPREFSKPTKSKIQKFLNS